MESVMNYFHQCFDFYEWYMMGDVLKSSFVLMFPNNGKYLSFIWYYFE